MNCDFASADYLMRRPDDKTNIRLILCKPKNGLIGEYSLRGTSTPMGISESKHLEKLPEQLKETLPPIGEIETEFASEEEPGLGSRHSCSAMRARTSTRVYICVVIGSEQHANAPLPV